MAITVDALVVTLGLDPTNFTKGQKEALEAFKKTQEAAIKGGKGIEEQSRKTMDALGGVKTQALEMFAILTGGAGVVAFVKDMTTADAAVGRVSRSTGIAAETVSKWQGAARLLGGDAATMAGAFVKMNDAFEGLKHGFGDPTLIGRLAGLSRSGGHPINPYNKDQDETFLQIADNLKAISDREGEGAAGAIGRLFVPDPAFLDLLLRGRDVTKQVLDQVREIGPATKGSANAAGELVEKWNQMILSAEGLSRAIGVQHGLAKFFGSLGEIVEGWSHGGKVLEGSFAAKTLQAFGFMKPGEGYTPAGSPNLFSGDASSSQSAQYRTAIAAIESRGSGGYAAVGPVTRSGDRAYGKYQVMGNNIGEWSQAALGKKISISEFMASPEAQDKIFDFKFGQYVKQFGNPQDAASAWFTGKPLSGGANNRDLFGTSGAGYASKFTAGLGAGGSSTSVAITGPITINAGPNASATDIASKLRDLGIKRQAEGNQSSVGGS